jgi:hypothetical protein
MNFNDYLRQILFRIINKIQEIEDKSEKKFLKLDRLFAGSVQASVATPLESRSKTPRANTRDRGMQTMVARKRGTDMATMTTDDLLVQPGKPVKKSQHQALLDLAVEEEFTKTLQLFDSFALYLAQIDNDVVLNQLNLQLKQQKEMIHNDSSMYSLENQGGRHSPF